MTSDIKTDWTEAELEYFTQEKNLTKDRIDPDLEKFFNDISQ